MENKGLLERYLKKYKELLCNLTRKNKELYYKEVKSSISLTELPKNKDHKKADSERYKRDFQPLRMESDQFKEMLSKSKLSLDSHYLLKDNPNLALEKKIDKIRTEDNKFQKEYGISGGWLLGPFLLWKQKNSQSKNDIVVTPIFKIPIDVSKKKGKKYDLILEEDLLELNPTLRLALEKIQGLKIEQEIGFKSVEEMLDDFQDCLKDQGSFVYTCCQIIRNA